MIFNLKKNEKGQAIVELALILPILMLLIFGITEFGRIFSTYLILANSAREGARQATVGATDSEIVLTVQNNASVLDSSNLIINISPSEGSRHRGDSVTISVQYPVTIYAPIISEIVGNPYSATGQAIMRVE